MSLPAKLTDTQRFWFEHIRTWGRGGGTLKAYAAREGLELEKLYRFKKILTRKGLLGDGAITPVPRFVRAQVRLDSEPVAMCRVRLANGCVVELVCEPNAFALGEILQAVGALP